MVILYLASQKCIFYIISSHSAQLMPQREISLALIYFNVNVCFVFIIYT